MSVCVCVTELEKKGEYYLNIFCLGIKVELNKSVFCLSEEEVNTIVQFLVKYFKNGDYRKREGKGMRCFIRYCFWHLAIVFCWIEKKTHFGSNCGLVYNINST